MAVEGHGFDLIPAVALLGLASRYGWVALPPEYQVFDNSWIIGTALFLYVVEFFADKIPWIDSAWDTLHTFIRPLGGALIALTALGEASESLPINMGQIQPVTMPALQEDFLQTWLTAMRNDRH